MNSKETNYGGVNFEDFSNAAKAVCNYLDGLTNTHLNHDKLTEEAMKALTVDSMFASIILMSISGSRERFVEQLKAQMVRDGHMPNPEGKPEDNTEATEENL